MYSQIRIAGVILCAILFQACAATAQVNKTTDSWFLRKYKEGDTYRYRLTTEVFHNGQPHSTIIAECSIRVVIDPSGIPYDEIRWLSSMTLRGKDTVDDSKDARSVMPYRISQHPAGRLNIPAIEVASMTGAITDFNTFFVATSPQLGVLQLAKVGDSIAKTEPVKGDFSNGKSILKGDDCLDVKIHFYKDTLGTVRLKTIFLPPAKQCLAYIIDDMQKAVIPGVPNNFQMVQPNGNEKYNVFYGAEEFSIHSMVRKSDGKLLVGIMDNQLVLQTKIQCDAAYKNCQGPFPFKIKRILKLELVRQ